MDETKRMSETLFPFAIVKQFAIEGFARGWDEALDAARAAVATVNVSKDTSYEMRMQALAAIDALREKP